MSQRPPIPDPIRAAERLKSLLPGNPALLVVLGSGLSIPQNAFEQPVELPFEALPGFPPAGVEGHAGRYLAGRLEGRAVLVQCGRYHFYEGHSAAVVGAPMRMAAALGVQRVLLTNSTGGIRPDLVPGRFVLIEDHLNLQGRSALGEARRLDEDRGRPSLDLYDRGLRRLAEAVAAREGIPLACGTYAGVLGPNFETPAEVRMLRALGGDLVGMSTVPEATVARDLGLAVLAISVVMNPATGLSPTPISHKELLAVGGSAGETLLRFVRGFVSQLSDAA